MKGIIILNNMPEDCSDCDFCQGGYFLSYLCGLTGEEFEFINGERKGFCLLKPLPQIKEERLKYLRHLGANIRELQCYIKGYNDCIDEILGEENE